MVHVYLFTHHTVSVSGIHFEDGCVRAGVSLYALSVGLAVESGWIVIARHVDDHLGVVTAGLGAFPQIRCRYGEFLRKGIRA